MIFNNIDFEEYVVVEFIRRKLLPPLELVQTKIPGRPGNVFRGLEIGAATVEVDIRIIAADRIESQAVARLVAGGLVTPTPRKLQLRDEPDKYDMAILSGEPAFDKFLHTGFSTLEFICPGGYAYSNALRTHNDIHNQTITNGGTAPATGILTVTMTSPAENLKIVLQNNGEFVQIADMLKINDIITIDLGEASVRKNDILIMDKVYLASDFFELPVGGFQLTTTNGTMALAFRERWL